MKWCQFTEGAGGHQGLLWWIWNTVVCTVRGDTALQEWLGQCGVLVPSEYLCCSTELTCSIHTWIPQSLINKLLPLGLLISPCKPWRNLQWWRGWGWAPVCLAQHAPGKSPWKSPTPHGSLWGGTHDLVMLGGFCCSFSLQGSNPSLQPLFRSRRFPVPLSLRRLRTSPPRLGCNF